MAQAWPCGCHSLSLWCVPRLARKQPKLVTKRLQLRTNGSPRIYVRFAKRNSRSGKAPGRCSARNLGPLEAQRPLECWNVRGKDISAEDFFTVGYCFIS